MNIVSRFKSLPISAQRTLGLGVVAMMFVALPLFVWAVVTQQLFFGKKAASGEPGVCVAVNKTIYVTDPWGSDEDSGCHDIQLAIDAVDGDGYTILIGHGDYNITKTIYITDKQNLKIEGNVEGSPDEVWLSFNTSGINNGGYGIKVENSSGSIQRLHAEGITPNGLLSIQNSTNFSVFFSKLVGTSSHTLDIQNSNQIEIGDSEIISSAGAIEIFGGSGTKIRYNRIHDSDNAIFLDNLSSVEITDNLIYNNGESGIKSQGALGNAIVAQNTVVDNGKSVQSPGILLGTFHSNFILSNNIVFHNNGAGIKLDGQYVNAVLNHNDVFSNTNNYVGMANPTGTNGNISTDPLLDTATGYYCLLTGSPALYGNVNNHEFMGKNGPCTTSTPTPSPQNSFTGQYYSNISLSGSPVLTRQDNDINFNWQHESPGLGVPSDNFSVRWSGTRNFNEGDYDFRVSTDDGARLIIDGVTVIDKWFDQSLNNYTYTTHLAAGAHTIVMEYYEKTWTALAILSWGTSTPSPSPTAYCSTDPFIINITPQIQTGNPGQTLRYNVEVTNNKINCGPYTTHLIIDKPSNWQAVFGTNTFMLAPNHTYSTYLDVTSSTDNYVLGNNALAFRISTDELGYMGTDTLTYNLELPTPIPGDVNGDGHVNIADIGILIDNYRTSPPGDVRADLNHDGIVNIVDIGIIIDNYEF